MRGQDTQQLARHSSITLTMDRYIHSFHGEQTAALDVLPDLTSPAQQTGKATGTADAISAKKNSADYLALKGQREATIMGADRHKQGDGDGGGQSCKSGNNNVFDSPGGSCDDNSSTGRGGRAAEGTGLLNRRTGLACTAGSNPALSAL